MTQGIELIKQQAQSLADLFLYSYKNEFLDNVIRCGHKRLASSSNLCYRYTDDLSVLTRDAWIISKINIHPS